MGRPKKFLAIIHGPNLNLLGTRQVDVYGRTSLKEVNKLILQASKNFDVKLDFFQSNYEGAIIEFIHGCRKWADGIVINPGAFTHYSIAIRDAITAVDLPTVEVHLSDISKREKFRQKSVIKDVCIGQFKGKGWLSYLDGVKKLSSYLD